MLLGGAALIAGAVPGRALSIGGANQAVGEPEAAFVVTKARFEPLDGAHPLGAEGAGDYHGAIEVVPDGGAVAVVNDVSVEDYVDGISEVPSEWPAAALQAQAIAARSYLLHSIRYPGPVAAAHGAQICADQNCQVYRGLAKERGAHGANWVAAVASTAGQVLLYNGRPINAMYSSSNGGRTVDGGEPYLRAMDDPDDVVAPENRWTATTSLTALASALKLPGAVTSVTRTADAVSVESSTASGNPRATGSPPASTSQPATPPGQAAPSAQSAPAGEGAAMTPPITTTPTTGSTTTTAPPGGPQGPASTVPGSPPKEPAPTTTTTGPSAGGESAPAQRGSLTTTAADFTRRVNAALPPVAGRDVFLASERFSVKLTSTNATFDGGGFGHGIGMSQYGALSRALRGQSAAEILGFYYSGLRPTRLDPAALPSTVRVDVADGLASTVVTGRFRLVDEHGAVLIAVGDGPWKVTPTPDGHVRVALPDAYRGAFGVAPVTIEPAVLAPGQTPRLHFALRVPGLASVTAAPPGAPAQVTQLGIVAPGTQDVALPPAPSSGTYTVSVSASAGVGREATATIEVPVGTTAAIGDQGLDTAHPASAGAVAEGVRPRALRTRPHGIGGAVTVASALVLAVGLGALGTWKRRRTPA